MMATDMVVKVGGSLFDLPDLGKRLQNWLDALPTRRVLLIPGGGAAADLVRQADALDRLGEERCHWLALRAMQFTAQLLAARLPGGQVVVGIADREAAWQRRQTPILDMHAFALADEARTDHCAHNWTVTSDSLAARVANVADISELVLLKSCPLEEGWDWAEAARQGVVDAAFPGMMAGSACRLKTVVVNFRR
jgi:5-(aminomethyl)-3-furanmethanol phosphate kinase